MKHFFVSVLVGFVVPGLASGAVLENPAPNSVQSGINLVSGWKCNAGRIEVIFDSGPPIQVAYGTTRGDTRRDCGDDNNGFGLLWNWNLLGAGLHTVRVLDNGVEFARATFTVVTTGEEFLTGLSGQAVAPQFPNPDLDTILNWEESLQNFVIVDSQPHVPERVCTEHFILGVLSAGQFIELEDETVWEVDFADRAATAFWSPPDDVLLCILSSDFGGTQTMINLDLRGDNIILVTRVN